MAGMGIFMAGMGIVMAGMASRVGLLAELPSAASVGSS
jgi:hypothetical protein